LPTPFIHHWTIGDITPSFPQETESSGAVEIIPVRELDDNELLSVSKDRRAALDLAEMRLSRNIIAKRDATNGC